MIGVALASLGALAEKIPGSADEIRAPSWVFGVLTFGVLAGLLYIVTRFNRDR